MFGVAIGNIKTDKSSWDDIHNTFRLLKVFIAGSRTNCDERKHRWIGCSPCLPVFNRIVLVHASDHIELGKGCSHLKCAHSIPALSYKSQSKEEMRLETYRKEPLHLHICRHNWNSGEGIFAITKSKGSIEVNLTSGFQGGSLGSDQDVLEVKLDIIFNTWHILRKFKNRGDETE